MNDKAEEIKKEIRELCAEIDKRIANQDKNFAALKALHMHDEIIRDGFREVIADGDKIIAMQERYIREIHQILRNVREAIVVGEMRYAIGLIDEVVDPNA